MKRTKLLLILIPILFLLCLSGCHRKGTVGDTGEYDGAVLVCAAVPYVIEGDSKFDKISKIEVDSFGRALYRYETYAAFWKETVEIYVVCQSVEDGLPLYYEDFCYLIHGASDGEFTDDELASLKEKNDWGKPLEPEKMRKVSKNWHLDWSRQCEKARDAAASALGLNDSKTVYLDALEHENDVWFVLVEVDAPKDGDRGNLYIMKYQQEQPVTQITQIKWTYDCQALIHEFKYPIQEN